MEKADFFLNLEAMDNSIAIALQVLRFIGETMMMNFCMMMVFLLLTIVNRQEICS